MCRLLLQTLGTSIAELVFGCCGHCPRKFFIQEIIKLEQTMALPKLVETIFDYKDDEGDNCMIQSFRIMSAYHTTTGSLPDSSMKMTIEVESTLFYFIKLAEDSGLNISKILNWTSFNGTTFFWYTANYSE